MMDMTITTPVRPAVPRRAVHLAFTRRYRLQRWTRNLARDGLQAAGWVVMAIPVALWLAYGGLQEMGSLAGFVTGLGIVAGLVATTAMVLMLLLAARVPVIDRVIGQDRAIALHRDLGNTTFFGLVAHALLLLVGYAGKEGVGPVAEFAGLWKQGDFALAVVALGLLVVVIVSSIVAVRRALPQEVWHAIHLVSYAAVAVAIPHQFSMSGLFSQGLPRLYWMAFLAVAAFCLLAFRVFLPLVNSFEQRLVVSRVDQVAPDVMSIEMSGPRVAELGARAGQYFHWRFLAPGLWWHQHPFSLSAAPTDTTLRVTVRALGRGTARLMSVRPGTPVLIEGPYGIFSDRARTAHDLVLVGIGIGIAPIRAVLEDTDFAPGGATVILRASRPEEVFLYDEIAALCHERGARLIVLTGPRGHYLDGTATWLPRDAQHLRLTDLVGPLDDADVYVCGPEAAADLVAEDALASGLSPDRLHRERFAW